MFSSIEKTKPKIKRSIVNKHHIIDKGKGQTLLGKTMDNDFGVMHYKRLVDQKNLMKLKKNEKCEELDMESETDIMSPKYSIEPEPLSMTKPKILFHRTQQQHGQQYEQQHGQQHGHGHQRQLHGQQLHGQQRHGQQRHGQQQLQHGQHQGELVSNIDLVVTEIYSHIAEIDNLISHIKDDLVQSLVLNNIRKHFTREKAQAQAQVQAQVQAQERDRERQDSKRVRFEVDEIEPSQLLKQIANSIEHGEEEKLPKFSVNLYQIEKWEVFSIIKMLNERLAVASQTNLGGPSTKKTLPIDIFQKLGYYYKKIVFSGQIPKTEERYVAKNEIVSKCLLSTWFAKETILVDKYILDECFFVHYLDESAKLEIISDFSLFYVINPGKSQLDENVLKVYQRGDIIQPIPISFLYANMTCKTF